MKGSSNQERRSHASRGGGVSSGKTAQTYMYHRSYIPCGVKPRPIWVRLPPCPGMGREARTAPAPPWEAARRAWTEEMPLAPRESYCSRLSPATGRLKAGYSTASQRCFSVCPPTNLAVKHQRHPSFHRGVAKALHIVGRAYRSPVGRHYNTYKTSSLTVSNK